MRGLLSLARRKAGSPSPAEMAVPPGYRVVWARPVDYGDGCYFYECQVRPQYWNPRYWLHRWCLWRALRAG